MISYHGITGEDERRIITKSVGLGEGSNTNIGKYCTSNAAGYTILNSNNISCFIDG